MENIFDTLKDRVVENMLDIKKTNRDETVDWIYDEAVSQLERDYPDIPMYVDTFKHDLHLKHEVLKDYEAGYTIVLLRKL